MITSLIEHSSHFGIEGMLARRSRIFAHANLNRCRDIRRRPPTRYRSPRPRPRRQLASWNLKVSTITQPRRTCSLGSLGSLDPMVNGNVQWTFECQMAMLTALSWVLLTGDYHTAEENVFIGFIGFIGSNGQWQCPMDI